MFEVEQSFQLSPEQQERLLTGAEFIHEKTISDTYYDSPNHALTRRDMWLRNRDGAFELKLPMGTDATELVDQYEEIEDEPGIRAALGITGDGPLSDALPALGYAAFCICTTVRRTYHKEEFTIVLDQVTYADCNWAFTTSEIELLVEHREEMPEAALRIAAFAKRHGLTLEYVHGKVLEFLERERPEHFQELVAAGVVSR